MVWQQVPLDRIYFDDVTGVPGTVWPIGTPEVPSDVIADVITMCAARNLHKVEVHGALVLGATMEHMCFIGHEHQDIADQLSLNGQDVDGNHMEGLILTGAQGGTGFLTLIRCTVNALTLFAGRMRDCSFYTSTSSFRDASFTDLIDCESISGAVTITVQAPTRASIKNWRGNLILTAQDGGVCHVRGFKGYLEIDAMTAGTINIFANGCDLQINGDCTGGIINIWGSATVTGAGGGVAINNYTVDTLITTVDTVVDAIKVITDALPDAGALNDLATLETRLTALRAGYLDELAAANLPTDISNIGTEVGVIDGIVDNIILDTQIRKVQSGVKVINAGITKYLHIDSGTNGAEIMSVAIEGVIAHDWSLGVYIPAADAEAATQAKSKRDDIVYAAADTEGGLLKPFGIPFDAYLDFTNDGVNDQIDQVTITYRSRGVLSLTWEA